MKTTPVVKLVLLFIILTTFLYGQDSKHKMESMLKWLPETYSDGNIYKTFTFSDYEHLTSCFPGVYSANARLNGLFRKLPKAFINNVSCQLKAVAFSTGFRELTGAEKGSIIKGLKKRKDIPKDVKERLKKNIASDNRPGHQVDWKPHIFVLKSGDISFKEMLKAGLFIKTGEQLEGFPVYKLGRHLSINKEPDNWAWFDGSEILITSNIIDNLPLMIYASQGTEPDILNNKAVQEIVKLGVEKKPAVFSFTDYESVSAKQTADMLKGGVPEKQVAAIRKDAESSFRNLISCVYSDQKSITKSTERQFYNTSGAINGRQGENWTKAEQKSGNPRYKDLDSIKREGVSVITSRKYSGAELEELLDRLKGKVKN